MAVTLSISFLPSPPIIVRDCDECVVVNSWYDSCVHLICAVQQSSRGVERGVGIENKLKKLNVWKGNSSCSFVEILGGGAC